MGTNIAEKFRKDYQPYPFDLKQVSLDFDFQKDHCIVKSKLDFNKKSEIERNELNDLILNGGELELLSISLDRVALTPESYRLVDGLLTISDVPANFVLEITTKIYPAKNTSLNGLYQSNHKYCTQCEAEGFRNITYFPDRPDVLTRYEVTIEAEQEGYPYLLSNGELLEQKALDNGRHMARWADPHPKPSYLFALVAGDFDLLQDDFETRSGKPVQLEIYVDKGKLDQCHFAMESLKKSMRWDEQTYGLEYDLNRYMIVAVGDFNMGAMENKGLNVFNTAYVLANDKTATDTDFEGVEAVIGHEYFHNWTGNRVTCQDWFQLSLKEGLTVFREQQFSGDMNSEAIQRIDDVKTLRAFQFPEDAGPMAHPIRPDSYIEMNNFYTHTVYIKGAEVIRMMETILGKAVFNQGVRHYLKKHDGQAVTCEDFVVAMEEVSGKDLKQFRNWYSQAGTPELNLHGQWLADENQFVLEIDQHCPPTPGQSYKNGFYIPLRMALIGADGKALSIDIAESDVEYDIVNQGREIVVMVNKSHQRLVFEQLDAMPTPSLLRGFSAPVKLSYPFNTEQRLQLISDDTDPYVKWQANQELVKYVVDNCLNIQAKNEAITADIVDELVRSRLAIIADDSIDPAFKALQLELPPLSSLMENWSPIPIAELIASWPVIKQHVSHAIKEPLNLLCERCDKELANENIERQDASKWRRLLCTAMAILANTHDDEVYEKAVGYYTSSSSMTIKQAMLCIIHHHFTDRSEPWLSDFYDNWQDEQLVLDKWFAIQATHAGEDAYDNVLELLNHADFTLTNPNRVRSVVGRFVLANPAQFHHESGRGYELLGKYVIKLNKKNPQLASRLCSGFNGWRHLNCEHRQEMIKKQLEKILAVENVSADVFEIANKALSLSGND